MVTKKRKNLETELRKLESQEETTKRLKYFYERNKEFYEKQNRDISYKIGYIISMIDKYNEQLAQKLSEQNKFKSILAKLEYSEDTDKYLDCLDEMSKPLEKIEFNQNLLNNEMILSYLQNTISFSKFMAIARILNGSMEEK